MGTYNIPYCPKKEQNYCHLACHDHLHPSWWLLLITTNCCLGRRCTYIIATESQVTVQVSFTVLVTLVLCPEIGSSIWRLSKLHHISTQNVHKLCMNVNDTFSGVSTCKWRLMCKFWQPYYVFPISEGSILRWFWDIHLVVNELSTKAIHRDNVLASANQV